MKISNERMEQLQISEIVKLYNLLMAEMLSKGNKPFTPVKKFKDRPTAEQRLFNLFAELDEKTVAAGMNKLGLEDQREEAVAVPSTKKKSAGKKQTKAEKEEQRATEEIDKGEKALAEAINPEIAKMEKDKDLFNQSGLKIGDYVFHSKYGTAQYKAMKEVFAKRISQGYFMMLEFANEEKLYVPLSAITLLEKCKNIKKLKLSKLAKNAEGIRTIEQAEDRIIRGKSPAAVASAPPPSGQPKLTPKQMMVLTKVRELIPPDAEGDAVYTNSTTVAKEMGTSTSVVFGTLDKLKALGLLKVEDDSPDDKVRFAYIYVLPKGREMNLHAVSARLPNPNPGPSSPFNGKKIHLLVKENPRRPGTHGYTSFSIIKEGMTYEAYRQAGGRNNDLTWDIDHNFVELK